ncbi:MAG: hypothetical protein Q6352_018260 [Candidatus Freyrarchaeum guaymaensis]|nr:hypothetical protein [Candidatus Sigynarchaeota archaeon]
MSVENPLSVLPLSLLYTPVAAWTIYHIFQGLHNWIFYTGVAVVVIGIVYRELTMHTVDREDYEALESSGVDLHQTRLTSILDLSLPEILKETRSLMLGIFFFLVLDAWLTYRYPPAIPLMHLVLVLGIPLRLTLLEFLYARKSVEEHATTVENSKPNSYEEPEPDLHQSGSNPKH